MVPAPMYPMFEARATAAWPILLAQDRGERRAGALLDQLLVPPLDRAVALAQVDHPAGAVAHDLDLDVARLGQVLLDVHRAVAERRQRLVLGQPEALGELLGVLRDPHALPAPAGGGLDDDREADLLRERQRLVGVLDRARRAGNGRHPGLLRQAPGGRLVAHLADLVAGGADEGDVAGPAGLGELGVLRQEAVARVDRVGAGDLRGGDDAGDAEVALTARRRARCRRRRRRSGRGATRGRPRCRRPPSRSPAPGTPG